MTTLNNNTLVVAIANARNLNGLTQEAKAVENKWWGDLSLAWDAIRELNPVDDTTGERDEAIVGRCYGESHVAEAYGINWIEMHCDRELWDMEQRDLALRDMYPVAKKLAREAISEKQQDAAKHLMVAVINMGRSTVEDMNKYDGAKRMDDRANELKSDYTSRWERSRMLLEYISEGINDWDAKTVLKYINLCDRRNKLDKKDEYRMLFPFYIASGVLLHAAMAERGYGKLQNRSKGLLNWFLEKYDHHDVEAQVVPQEDDEVVKFGFDENRDSDEEATDKVAGNAFSVNVDSMIDLKDYCVREAGKRGVTPMEVLEEIDESQVNWL